MNRLQWGVLDTENEKSMRYSSKSQLQKHSWGTEIGSEQLGVGNSRSKRHCDVTLIWGSDRFLYCQLNFHKSTHENRSNLFRTFHVRITGGRGNADNLDSFIVTNRICKDANLH